MNDWQINLYLAAIAIPLAAFVVQILGGRWLKELNAHIATAAIGTSFVLSLIGFVDYFVIEAPKHPVAHHHAEAEGESEGHKTETASSTAKATDAKTTPGPLVWKGRFDWVSVGGGIQIPGRESTKSLTIPWEFAIDSLSAIMYLMVTLIATSIHVYSMGYMHGDRRYPRFFAYLSLFCFSMLALIGSANLFMVFMSWELVGVCSYLLIGHWYEEKKNADAANKAFIVNRVGDVGMLIGLGLLWTNLGTFNISEINHSLRNKAGELNIVSTESSSVVELRNQETGEPIVDGWTGKPRQIATWALVLAGLGVFAGCVGKSAQFPLHVWLPDAMAGPTPVSALIHAATMVAAGVYLVGRFFPLFTDEVLLTIGYAGGITLFIAATIAMVQVDYKKVLAYSTVSQLGYMMLGLGVGGWSAGLFHLLTHAFFKALLFLCAGSVYHSVHTYDMHVLGGLRKKMPRTATTMLIGTLAISGVPLFSGFYSKDAILASSLKFVSERPSHFLLFVLPTVGAAITAFYMFRLWLLLFYGESRSAKKDAHGHGHDHGHGHGHGDHHHDDPVAHAHESEPIMTIPLMVLAAFAVFVGWPITILPFAEPIVEQMLLYSSPLPPIELGIFHWIAMGFSLVVAATGIGLAFAFYAWKTFDAKKFAESFQPLYRLFSAKWYFDEIYDLLLVKRTLDLAVAMRGFDKYVVDGVVNGAAMITVWASKLDGLFDKFAVDKLVNLFGDFIYLLGDRGRWIQTGRLRNYLMVLTVAVFGLFLGVVVWIQRG